MKPKSSVASKANESAIQLYGCAALIFFSRIKKIKRKVKKAYPVQKDNKK
jgi:hypothetical protein